MTEQYICQEPMPGDQLVYEWQGGRWELVGLIPATVPAHLHPTLSDVNFTGSIAVAGSAGISGRFTIGSYKLSFKNGVVVGCEPV